MSDTSDSRDASALRARLRARARVFDDLRAFFAGRGVIEVSTPALSAAGATDPALHNIRCDIEALGGRHYLQTSPEHAMKRLLAAGSGDIWQLARVFRDGELGRWHQPEFLLLEWYRVGFDEFDLMDEVFELVRCVAARHGRQPARETLSYAEAFRKTFGIDALTFDATDRQALTEALHDRGIDVPAGLPASALLDLALGTVIVPGWPADTAVFLHDYPLAQAALARIRPGEPPVAARFEVFLDGIELGNGFAELTDAAEQRLRFEAELKRRRASELEAVPMDEQLLEALARGLPDCAGVALGFDRLLAVLTGARELAAVVDWPHAVRAADAI